MRSRTVGTVAENCTRSQRQVGIGDHYSSLSPASGSRISRSQDTLHSGRANIDFGWNFRRELCRPSRLDRSRHTVCLGQFEKKSANFTHSAFVDTRGIARIAFPARETGGAPMKHQFAAHRLQKYGLVDSWRGRESVAALFASDFPLARVTHGSYSWSAAGGLQRSGIHSGQHDRSLSRCLSSTRSRHGGQS